MESLEGSELSSWLRCVVNRKRVMVQVSPSASFLPQTSDSYLSLVIKKYGRLYYLFNTGNSTTNHNNNVIFFIIIVKICKVQSIQAQITLCDIVF